MEFENVCPGIMQRAPARNQLAWSVVSWQEVNSIKTTLKQHEIDTTLAHSLSLSLALNFSFSFCVWKKFCNSCLSLVGCEVASVRECVCVCVVGVCSASGSMTKVRWSVVQTMAKRHKQMEIHMWNIFEICMPLLIPLFLFLLFLFLFLLPFLVLLVVLFLCLYLAWMHSNSKQC